MNHDDSTTYRGCLPKNAAALRIWHDTGPGEAALEPALPIVDPHHHLFGKTTDAQYYRRFDLERDLAGGHRIVGTVYVEAYASGWRTSGPEHLRPVGEVEMIASQVAGPANTAHGHCDVAAGIIAHADLTLGQGVNEVLEAQLDAAQGRLRGIRQVAAHDDGLVGRFIQHLPKQHLLANTDFRAGLAQLHRHGLSFDIWIYYHQMRELIELVDCFPQTTFILDHVGGLMASANSGRNAKRSSPRGGTTCASLRRVRMSMSRSAAWVCRSSASASNIARGRPRRANSRRPGVKCSNSSTFT